MDKFIVEYRGIMRTLNVDMLRQLLQRGFITMDTRLLIDGREGRVGDIADQLHGSPSSQPSFTEASEPPQGGASVSPPPFVTDVPAAVSVPTGKVDDDDLINLDDFLQGSEEGEEGGKPKSKKTIVVIGVVLAFVAIVGSGAFAFWGRLSRFKRDLEMAGGGVEVATGESSNNDFSNDGKTTCSDEVSDKEFCNKPFDDSMTSIPKGFKGCDIVALYHKLDGLFDIEKDEYEKTQEFEKRRDGFVREALEKRILGEITPSSRIAVDIEIIGQEYNADLEQLKLTVYAFTDSSSIQTWSVLDRKEYTGSNGYGVETTVIETTSSEYGVIAVDECNDDYGKDFELKIQAREARNIKDSIKAFLIFTMSPKKDEHSETYKVVNYTSSHEKPTMSLPFERYEFEHGVYGKQLEVWFYNSETGKILLKGHISGKEQEEKKSETISSIEEAIPEVEATVEDVTATVEEATERDFSRRNGSYSNNGYQSDERRNYEPEEEELDYPETLDETDELDRTRRNNKSKKKNEKEDVPPPKTWQQLIAESVDEVANWEKKKPTLIVPGDCDTLADALEKASAGDVIQLKKNAPGSYSLGVKPGSARLGIIIDKPVAIVGETGDASDVVIKVGVNESIFVESKSAMFKGITFQCGPLGFGKTYEPIVSVSAAGSATFKYCEFVGDGVERSVGVLTSGNGAKSAFWKCVFHHFGDSGLKSTSGSRATLSYCEFLDENHYAFTSEDGASVLLDRCHFADNEICIHAETGGSCEITESRFAGNKRRAEISPASRNKVVEAGNVYDKK